MIDIKNLIEYLPFYYKDSDTYKDSNGKGILEKFLEICGTYFQDNIKKSIDNTLEHCLKVDKDIDDVYLNYIWESFGKFPFAKPDSKSIFNLSKEQKIDLIRYVISLYKIRGSRKFYEIIFRLYSNKDNLLELKNIEETSPDYLSDFRDGSISRDNTDSTDLWPYFDMSNFDSTENFDEYREISLHGQVDFYVSINPLISTNMKEVWNIIKNLIDTYLPFHTVSNLILNGKNHEEKDYNFNVFLKTGDKWLPQATGAEVDLQPGEDILLKVRLVDKEGNLVKNIPWYSDMVYTKGKKASEDPNYYKGQSEHSRYYGEQIFTIPSVYRVKDSFNIKEVTNKYRFYLESSSDSFEFEVKNTKYTGVSNYVIYVQPHTKELDGIKPIEVTIEAYKLNEDGTKQPCRVFSEWLNVSEKSFEGNNYLTKWKINKAGTFGFYVLENPNYRVEVTIKDYVPAYKVLLGYKYSHIKDPLRPYKDKPKYEEIDKLNEKVDHVKISTMPWLLTDCLVKVNILPIGPGKLPKDITVQVLGTSIYLKNGDTWNPLSMTTYTFVPTMGDTLRNQPATLEITDKNIDFNLYIDYNDDFKDTIKDTIQGISSEAGATIKYQPLNDYTEECIKSNLLSWVISGPDNIDHIIGYGHSELSGEEQIFTNDKYTLEAIEVPEERKGLRIKSKVPGIFTIRSSVRSLRLGTVNKVTFKVKDGRVGTLIPDKFQIVPINTWTNNWLDDKPSNRVIYRYKKGGAYPKFRLQLLDKLGNIIDNGNVEFKQVPYSQNPEDQLKNVYGNIEVQRDTSFTCNYNTYTFSANIRLITLEAEPIVLNWVGNKDGMIIGDVTKELNIKATDNISWTLEKSQE
jgi:hypothetical protein|nr:MAG TPA: hypothetical protein [Caudoviricetes sp.]